MAKLWEMPEVYSLMKSYHSLFIALPESIHHMVALMRDWLRGYTSTIANWLT